ncbi:MAG: hypothetical protein ACUVTW_15655, partial [Thermogutta sp.]
LTHKESSMRQFAVRLGVLASVATLVIAVVLIGSWSTAEDSAKQPSAAQPQVSAPQPATADADQPNAAKQTGDATEFRPRLPAYYARVVTEEQRQKIYAIQREYYPRIAALRKQLEDLIAEQNGKIEAVLTPQQKAELERLRGEAAARRGSKAAATGATGDTSAQ